MKFTLFLYFLLSLLIIFSACKPGGPGGILSRKTLREKYQDKMIKDFPARQSLAWMIAGEKNLLFPQQIALPYAETGVNLTDTTDATGFRFQLKPGQQLEIGWRKMAANHKVYLGELWQINTDSSRKLLLEADTVINKISLLTESGGDYIFRFQPLLGSTGGYSLNINAIPFFTFPVLNENKKNIGSFWGADRDGGARRHEGVDIFAGRGTPVVAVANGRITRVANGGLGGKHIFLGTDSLDVNVYYAHLDSQLVSSGQAVQRGEVIGLVGNTGNAESTAPHLHFGIYTRNGAVDPLTFIQPTTTLPLPAAESNLPADKITVEKGTRIFEMPNNKSPLLPLIKVEHFYILARHQQYYRVLLSDGRKGFVEVNRVKK